MTRDQTFFVLMALAIVAAATAAILYQHGVHTGLILQAAGSGSVSVGGDAFAGTLSSNPVNSPGANSPATGVWTPIGPTHSLGPFPYVPPQWGYGGGQTMQ